MKKYSKYLILLGIIIFGAFLFYNKVFIPKNSYEMIDSSRGELDVSVFGLGNVGAKNIYKISAGVNAKILEIKYDEGEWVKKGDLLALLDSVDLPILLQQSKISVVKAESELIASKKELDSLYAQRDLALVTYNRYKKLKKQSFASQSEYDKAKADLKAIEAQMAATLAHIDSAKTEIKRVQKSVESLEVKLQNYKVYAPVDGYIISKDAEVAQSVAMSQSILTLVNPEDVWVKAYIDEKISGDVQLNQKATITLRSHSDKEYKGRVKRIVAQSDAITGEREVDVAFEKLPLPFYMNEQAEVIISTKNLHNVVKIPTSVLIYKDKKSGVWVREGMRAHFKEVKVLAISNAEVAIEEKKDIQNILLPSSKKRALTEGMKVY
ncbi:efflux RND transporter periplasmic adaptor subunit [Sulfurimonas sp. SAG-AH-194-L11]|nr:efflux RND transporter periplasmic adaptor subunit [Sulfurimonas sp. SAG-AH-194-L11]MDF1876960.1 efflux RND transporter periplasmic adaptor subunit [Sulfurimonas sp. SAG-AH-194-L11]